jgi:threonine synthase
VRGNFDDCQSRSRPPSPTRPSPPSCAAFGLALSSANSINWGRLLPQIVYYVSAYADMVAAAGVVAGADRRLRADRQLRQHPGAYYAKRMGVPIGRLICASNENNVLADFIATGVYDISERGFVTTPSPSMDILVSSNLERQLYELTRDTARIAEWMAELREDVALQGGPRHASAAMREHFAATS